MLFFTGLSGSVTGDVVYKFQGVSVGSTTMTPFQMTKIDASTPTYNDDITASVTVTDTAFEGTLDLSVSPTTGVKAGSTLTYTMTVGNSGDQTLGDPDSGNGVIVTADIPTNTTYVAGSLVSTSDFRVQWSTDNEASWVDAEPTASSVTDVRWVLNSPVPANTLSAVTDTLQVTVNSCVASGTTITGKSSIAVGSNSGLASDTAGVTAGIPDTDLALTKTGDAGPVLSGTTTPTPSR